MRVNLCNESMSVFRCRRAASCAMCMTALAIATLLALTPRQAPASVFTVNISQQGSDVVVSGSGSFDLTGLTFENSGSSAVDIRPSTGELGVGNASGFFDDLYFNNASFGPGLTGPGSFGSGGSAIPSSGTAPDFLFDPGNALVLPQGYVSGTMLADSSTYSNATLTGLGLTPGTYTWTWDTGLNSLVLNVVPEPSSLMLFGAGIFGITAIRRRRRVF